jgi:hypothetical protein
MRTLDDQIILERCGFPFDDPAARPDWVRAGLAAETLKRTYQTEQLADGRSLQQITEGAGISIEQTLHHLAKAPDEWDAHEWERPVNARGVVIEHLAEP